MSTDSPSVEELVLVHLFEVEASDRRTTAAICDALGVGASVSDRVEVLAALSALGERQLLEKRPLQDGRMQYRLTENGTRAAASLHEAFADRTVELVADGHSQTDSVAGVRDELDAPSIAPVLERAVDGRVVVDDVPAETFVGREAELAAIDERIAAAGEGASATVAVAGERGVGKTELLGRAGDRADATVVSVSCRAEPAEPFEAVRTALADHDRADVFDRERSDPEERDVLDDLRAELFDDVREAVGSLVGDDPVLVLVDDVDHASPEVAALFGALVGDLPPGIVLVLAGRTSGPTASGEGWLDRFETDERIDLAPLSADATRELVVRSLRDRSVPESLTDRIHERTGGTPLFVLGVVDRLLAEGAVDPAAGAYPGAAEPLPTPSEGSETIRRRLAALDEPARALIEDAALVGHTVDVDVLLAVSDLPPSTVRTYLELFAETGLFESADPPRFHGELIREVVLTELSGLQARQRHELIGDAYHHVRDDPPRAAIAHHYEQAGLDRAALDQYRQAGEQAMDVYANERALEAYERALSLARDLAADEVLLDIAESIGQVHYVTGEYDEADRYFEFVRERTDDPERIQRGYRYQAEMAIGRGEIDGADEYARAGIEAVEEPNRTSCRLIGHRGTFRLRRGDLDAAEEYFERQHDLARELDDEDRLGGAYHNLGTIAHRRGEVGDAIDFLERAVEYNERSGATTDAIASYNNLAMAYDRAGRIDDVVDALETSRSRAADVGDRAVELTVLGNLAGRYRHQGDLERAERTVEEVIDEARERGLSIAVGSGLVTLGLVRTDRCQFDRARRQFEEAIELFESIEHTRMLALARCGFVRLAVYDDALETARSLLDATEAISDGIEPELRAVVQYRRGDLERSLGNGPVAIEAYERSLEHARSCGNRQSQTRVRYRLGVARSDASGGDEGLSTARRAVEDAETFDAPLLRARTNTALARCHRNAGNYEAAETALDTAADTLDGIGASLYECFLRIERGLLAVDRGDDDGGERLEAATAFVDQCGVSIPARGPDRSNR